MTSRPASPAGRRLQAGGASLRRLQDGDESLLGDVDLPDALHSFLSFFLLLEQLAFARNITAVALRGDVLAQGRDAFARHDLAANRRLDRHLVELTRDHFL